MLYQLSRPLPNRLLSTGSQLCRRRLRQFLDQTVRVAAQEARLNQLSAGLTVTPITSGLGSTARSQAGRPQLFVRSTPRTACPSLLAQRTSAYCTTIRSLIHNQPKIKIMIASATAPLLRLARSGSLSS